ncbi:MAG: FGGY family carbohydrate kinase [bacterium]
MALKSMVLIIALKDTCTEVQLLNSQAKVCASATQEYSSHDQHADMISYDPIELLFHVRSAIQQVLQQAKQCHIAHILICNHSQTAMYWDADSGKPLSPVIGSTCLRGISSCRFFQNNHLADDIYHKTGLPLSPSYLGIKCHWLNENFSDAFFSKKIMFGGFETWLLYQLSGKKAYCMSLCQASQSMLFNISSCDWDPLLCSDCLPQNHLLPKVISDPSSIFAKTLHFMPLLDDIPITIICHENKSKYWACQHFNFSDLVIDFSAERFSLLSHSGHHFNKTNTRLPQHLIHRADDSLYLFKKTVELAPWPQQLFPQLSTKLLSDTPISLEHIQHPQVIIHSTSLPRPSFGRPKQTLGILGLDATSSIDDLTWAFIAHRAFVLFEAIESLSTVLSKSPQHLFFASHCLSSESYILCELLQRPLSCFYGPSWDLYGCLLLFQKQTSFFSELSLKKWLKSKTLLPNLDPITVYGLKQSWTQASSNTK